MPPTRAQLLLGLEDDTEGVESERDVREEHEYAWLFPYRGEMVPFEISSLPCAGHRIEGTVRRVVNNCREAIQRAHSGNETPYITDAPIERVTDDMSIFAEDTRFVLLTRTSTWENIYINRRTHDGTTPIPNEVDIRECEDEVMRSLGILGWVAGIPVVGTEQGAYNRLVLSTWDTVRWFRPIGYWEINPLDTVETNVDTIIQEAVENTTTEDGKRIERQWYTNFSVDRLRDCLYHVDINEQQIQSIRVSPLAWRELAMDRNSTRLGISIPIADNPVGRSIQFFGVEVVCDDTLPLGDVWVVCGEVVFIWQEANISRARSISRRNTEAPDEAGEPVSRNMVRGEQSFGLARTMR